MKCIVADVGFFLHHPRHNLLRVDASVSCDRVARNAQSLADNLNTYTQQTNRPPGQSVQQQTTWPALRTISIPTRSRPTDHPASLADYLNTYTQQTTQPVRAAALLARDVQAKPALIVAQIHPSVCPPVSVCPRQLQSMELYSSKYLYTYTQQTRPVSTALCWPHKVNQTNSK